MISIFSIFNNAKNTNNSLNFEELSKTLNLPLDEVETMYDIFNKLHTQPFLQASSTWASLN
ncbi:hypothetical protein [Lysinibacillus sphaericus]|uniref:hypothetical protein n=1 Tax=Lysinibacillus sphaericus TaxID=1421 RepID=UPI003D712754